MDGDTYWHVATGRWILENGVVPTQDPFSHTMRGTAWTAFEWLSQVILAAAHQLGGWTGLVALTALAFAATIALLTRALLRWLEPIYAVHVRGVGDLDDRRACAGATPHAGDADHDDLDHRAGARQGLGPCPRACGCCP